MKDVILSTNFINVINLLYLVGSKGSEILDRIRSTGLKVDQTNTLVCIIDPQIAVSRAVVQATPWPQH